MAVWKGQAESLEEGFMKKANAEIAIWKLDAELSKQKLSSSRKEIGILR